MLKSLRNPRTSPKVKARSINQPVRTSAVTVAKAPAAPTDETFIEGTAGWWRRHGDRCRAQGLHDEARLADCAARRAEDIADLKRLGMSAPLQPGEAEFLVARLAEKLERYEKGESRQLQIAFRSVRHFELTGTLLTHPAKTR